MGVTPSQMLNSRRNEAVLSWRADPGDTRGTIGTRQLDRHEWCSQRFVYMRSLLRHPATDDHPLPPRSELVIAALDCSGQQVILDRSGIWLPHDWSPDGKRMLVSYKTSLNPQKASYALFELDLDAANEEMSRARSSPKPPGPKDQDGIPSGGGLRVVLPLARTIGSSIARYAPDGKSIACFGSSLEHPSDELIVPGAVPFRPRAACSRSRRREFPRTVPRAGHFRRAHLLVPRRAASPLRTIQ